MIPPESHWRTRAEQRLYVAFCELASSLLDYAAGADTLEGVKASPARLNWAATSLYYSIVHTARLLVFVPYGDFPTSHAQLPHCLERNESRFDDLACEVSSTECSASGPKNWSRSRFSSPSAFLGASRCPGCTFET